MSMTSAVAPRSALNGNVPKLTKEHSDVSRVFASRVVAISNLIALGLGAILVFGLYAYYLRQSGKALYFTPYSLLEEAAYTYTSAKNYLQFGYLNSGLLQDFSTSPDIADHPFAYNHMPPGPDLFTSVLLWLFSSNYVWVRAFFATSMLAGVVAYFLFARALLRHLGAHFPGIVLALLSPWVIIQLFDRQIYSPFLLLVFLPLLLTFQFLKTGKPGYFITSLVIIVLSAIYIEYSLLSAVIFCWTMLYFMQLLPLKFRHMAVIGAAFGLGIGAHLVQNMLYLGWDNFVLELKLTISNRTTGFPTQEELKDFYHRLGLVHHGSRPVERGALWAQIAANFSLPVTPSARLMLFACAVWIVFGRGIHFNAGDGRPVINRNVIANELWLILRLAAWAAITVLAPMILFPAFAQEVNLRGVANVFFLAIPLAFLAGYGIWALAYSGHRAACVLIDPAGSEGRSSTDITEPGPALVKLLIYVGRAVALTGICLALIDGSIAVFRNVTNEVGYIQRLGQNPQKWDPLYDIRRFNGDLFMTNINVPTVGFLTSAPGFGVCSPDSVKKDGEFNLRECKTSFMRRHDYWLTQRPRYFFYFSASELFPGFADCMPAGLVIGSTRGSSECMQQLRDTLDSQYPLVMKNELVSVYDLAARKGQ